MNQIMWPEDLPLQVFWALLCSAEPLTHTISERVQLNSFKAYTRQIITALTIQIPYSVIFEHCSLRIAKWSKNYLHLTLLKNLPVWFMSVQAVSRKGKDYSKCGDTVCLLCISCPHQSRRLQRLLGKTPGSAGKRNMAAAQVGRPIEHHYLSCSSGNAPSEV